MSDNTQLDFFLQAAQTLNIPLPKDSIPKFEVYFQELISWNKKINLTRIIERKKFFIEHFIDSLIAERYISKGKSLIDLGSGGGFPGLPLKIIRPDLAITLVESSLKKTAFLHHIIRTLGLKGVAVREERVENIDGLYGVVIGRAFAPLVRFLPLALSLKAPKGIVIAMKGPNFSRELKAVKLQLGRRGGEIKLQDKFLLPITNKQRTIIVFE